MTKVTASALADAILNEDGRGMLPEHLIYDLSNAPPWSVPMSDMIDLGQVCYVPDHSVTFGSAEGSFLAVSDDGDGIQQDGETVLLGWFDFSEIGYKPGVYGAALRAMGDKEIGPGRFQFSPEAVSRAFEGRRQRKVV